MLKVKQPSFSLVVSSYKEDVEWTKNVKMKVFLYNKDKDTKRTDIIKLENIGRESHTYLHHIVEHYDDLDDVIVFCQGHPFDHCKEFLEILNQDSIEEINKLAKKLDNRNWPNDQQFAPIGHIYHCNTFKEANKCNWYMQYRLPFSLIAIETMFPKKRPVKVYDALWGSQFAITKKRIHEFSKDQYKILLKFHEQFWSFPWAMENIWITIFCEERQPHKLPNPFKIP